MVEAHADGTVEAVAAPGEVFVAGAMGCGGVGEIGVVAGVGVDEGRRSEEVSVRRSLRARGAGPGALGGVGVAVGG